MEGTRERPGPDERVRGSDPRVRPMRGPRCEGPGGVVDESVRARSVRGPPAALGQRGLVRERTRIDRGRVPASGAAQAVRGRLSRPPSRPGREGPASFGRRWDASGPRRLGGPGGPRIPEGRPLAPARAGPIMAHGPADPQGPRPPQGDVDPERPRARAEHRSVRSEEARGLPADLRGRRGPREDETAAFDGEAPGTAEGSTERSPGPRDEGGRGVVGGALVEGPSTAPESRTQACPGRT